MAMTHNQITALLCILTFALLINLAYVYEYIVQSEDKREFVAKCEIDFNESVLQKECQVHLKM